MNICPAGYYCVAGTSDYTKTPCPEGTYSASRGASDFLLDCKTCPAGAICTVAGIATWPPQAN